MPNSGLFALTFLIGLACLIKVYFARNWSQRWRYGLLIIGNAFLLLAGYLDPWWHIGEWDDARDILLWVGANAVVIARIKKDVLALKQIGITPAVESNKPADPPTVVLVALAVTTIHLVAAFDRDLHLMRIVLLAGLLSVLGIALYLNRSLGKVSLKQLNVLAGMVIVLSLLLRFGHSEWLSSIIP